MAQEYTTGTEEIYNDALSASVENWKAYLNKASFRRISFEIYQKNAYENWILVYILWKKYKQIRYQKRTSIIFYLKKSIH